jgi:2'-5' RNA ligase
VKEPPVDTAIPIRTFVALELPSRFQRKVGDLAAVLKPRFEKVRWTAAEVHLTLRFLGKALPDQLRRLEAPLRLAALSCPRAEIHFEGLGLFLERGSRSALAGRPPPERVLALREECEAAAVTAGFPSRTVRSART